jgi:GntR family transcriptional regulator
MRYRAIADTIREEIALGEHGPGEALPSQSALAERFGTTVSTVRQALRLLEEEGLLEFQHGVGSFVSGLTDDHRSLQLTSFSGALRSRGADIETRVLGSRREADAPEVARWFGGGERRFALLERLRLVSGRPVVYQRSYVPLRHARVLERYDPEKDLYGELSRSLRRVIAVAVEELDAVTGPPEVATILEVGEEVPLFRSRRISKTLSGEPVLFDLAYMVGGLVRVELYRRGRFSEFNYEVDVDGGENG